MIGVTGKPCSAYPMAGASACDSVIVPKRCSSACQPASAPGTVTSSTLSVGMVRCPRASTASRVMRRPARPLEFKPYSLRSFADHTMANMSPPIPVIIGSATFSTAAAVTAASIALPPRSNTAKPAAVASGWLVAIMPCGAYTVERWAMVEGRGSCPKATATSQASALEASQSVRRIMRGICRGAPPGARSAGARRGATGTALRVAAPCTGTASISYRSASYRSANDGRGCSSTCSDWVAGVDPPAPRASHCLTAG